MECPICFEEVTDGNQIVLPCNHRFRAPCIDQYISKSISKAEPDQVNCLPCPYCRRLFRFVPADPTDIEEGKPSSSKKYVVSPHNIDVNRLFCLCCLSGFVMLATIGAIIGAQIFT